MAEKYSNLNPIQLFGNYTDPYADRRGTGPVRPAQPLPARQPQFPDSGTEGLYFGWFGHSSVFLRLDGRNILIDPVFARFTSPLPFAGPERFPGRPVSPAELPAIDLVLITHSHYDHLDRGTVRALDGRVGRYIVPRGVGGILRRFGIAPGKITELGWYEAAGEGSVEVILTPSQHGSARSPFDGNRTLWGSFLLRGREAAVFDSGDGGFGTHFGDIARRYGAPDLAILECGQYNVRWHGVHMFPEESAEAGRLLGAKLCIPVHWGAYVLSDHPWDDPPKRFARRAQELGVPFRIPELNEIRKLGF